MNGVNVSVLAQYFSRFFVRFFYFFVTFELKFEIVLADPTSRPAVEKIFQVVKQINQRFGSGGEMLQSTSQSTISVDKMGAVGQNPLELLASLALEIQMNSIGQNLGKTGFFQTFLSKSLKNVQSRSK